MTPQSAALLAAYNRWINERIFDAAATLDAETLKADKGAFFGSILGTLNHIAVADTLWLQRFAQHEPSFMALHGVAKLARPTSLSQWLADDLPVLRSLRRELDAALESWVAELKPEHLSTNVAYSSMAGVAAVRNFGALLQHLFNHQTHHRGQVTTLLFQCGVDVGVTDLMALIPAVET